MFLYQVYHKIYGFSILSENFSVFPQKKIGEKKGRRHGTRLAFFCMTRCGGTSCKAVFTVFRDGIRAKGKAHGSSGRRPLQGESESRYEDGRLVEKQACKSGRPMVARGEREVVLLTEGRREGGRCYPPSEVGAGSSSFGRRSVFSTTRSVPVGNLPMVIQVTGAPPYVVL